MVGWDAKWRGERESERVSKLGGSMNWAAIKWFLRNNSEQLDCKESNLYIGSGRTSPLGGQASRWSSL